MEERELAFRSWEDSLGLVGDWVLRLEEQRGTQIRSRMRGIRQLLGLVEEKNLMQKGSLREQVQASSLLGLGQADTPQLLDQKESLLEVPSKEQGKLAEALAQMELLQFSPGCSSHLPAANMDN